MHRYLLALIVAISVGLSARQARFDLEDMGVLGFGGVTSGDEIVEILRSLTRGRSSSGRVYVVESEAALRGLFERLSAGGRTITPASYDGRMVLLADDTRVGWRNGSTSGGATIDVVVPGRGGE